MPISKRKNITGLAALGLLGLLLVIGFGEVSLASKNAKERLSLGNEKETSIEYGLGGVWGTGVSRGELQKIRAHPLAGQKVSSGRYEATAYGPPWNAMQGGPITSTGIALGTKRKRYIVAVDPEMIAYGTLVRIWPNPFGWRGPFVAADTGGAIRERRVDFYDWRGRKSQYGWGRRDVRLWVSKKPS